MNYQLLMEEQLKKLGEAKPSLLLHACCAPCSSYVLEYLSQYFDITILFYNPNIFPESEFKKRYEEACRLIKEMPCCSNVKIEEYSYNYQEFEQTVSGFEKEKEGGARCLRCYRLRLEKSAKYACEHRFDYFTTTLSISPYKSAKHLNEIGKSLEQEYHVNYLYADFKKKNGYHRSIELSHQYQLYRQNYCGCVYSKQNT